MSTKRARVCGGEQTTRGVLLASKANVRWAGAGQSRTGGGGGVQGLKGRSEGGTREGRTSE